MYNRKKKHKLKSFLTEKKHKANIKRVSNENTFVGSSTERKKDTDDDDDHMYKLYYAELMKIFAVESGSLKSSNLDEVQLDQNIILTAEQYVTVTNELYEVRY